MCGLAYCLGILGSKSHVLSIFGMSLKKLFKEINQALLVTGNYHLMLGISHRAMTVTSKAGPASR